MYPLKINEVRVTDGRITYADQEPFAPLEVTPVNLTAQNIRKIRSNDRTYPRRAPRRGRLPERPRGAGWPR